MVERLRHYLERARTLPPRTALRRAGQVLRREGAACVRRFADRVVPTLEVHPPSGPPLARYFAAVPAGLLRPRANEILARSALCIAHRFDLLGSGWTEVCEGVACRGLEGHRYASVVVPGEDPCLRLNRANRSASRRVRQLIAADYRRIDWQIDFKSGHRWREGTWYRNIAFGHKPGADVKVPWELSRMQHLAVLAPAFALAREGEPGFLPPQAYSGEFRSQVLDFIAANPPRYGVAWACTMDASIRVVNWLVARDLLLAAGAVFDPAFEERFSASVEEHARHIVANLEWSVELRGNHYLADVCGLAFAAAFLPSSPRADAWLAFAVRELVTEAGLQFHPDGSSFEASTGYHRLSAEMLVWTTALVLGLSAERRAALTAYDHRLQPHPPGLAPAPLPVHPIPGSRRSSPFPPWYWERLERLADFTLRMAGPDGRVPAVGDLDSGRFLKLWPALRAEPVAEVRRRWANVEDYDGIPEGQVYWGEDLLDHRHLLGAAAGLFARPDFVRAAGDENPETYIVRHLAGVSVPAGRDVTLIRPTAVAEALPAAPEGASTLEIPLPGADLRAGLELRAWPGFGLYLFRSERLYLLVRCGTVGQRGWGGHAHHDQLGLVLAADGRTIIADPGSYLYTPLPHRRNEYRSVRAHCAPRTADGREPGRLDAGLFRLPDLTRAECLHFGPGGFLGRHRGYGPVVWRRVEILADRLRIADWGEGLELLPPELPPPGTVSELPLSPAYGWRERR